MRIIMSILFCFMVVSCNQNSENGEQRYQDRRPACGDKNNFLSLSGACLPPMPNWLITVDKIEFPQNALIKVEGNTLLDECSGDNSPFIITRNNPIIIEAEKFFSPGDGGFSFEIINLGSNCLGTETYYLNVNQEFTISGEDNDKLLEFTIE